MKAGNGSIQYFQACWFYHDLGDGDWPDLAMAMTSIDERSVHVSLREVNSSEETEGHEVFDWEVIKSFSLKEDGCSDSSQNGCVHYCRNDARLTALECEVAAYLIASRPMAQCNPDMHDFDGIEMPHRVRTEPQGELVTFVQP